MVKEYISTERIFNIPAGTKFKLEENECRYRYTFDSSENKISVGLATVEWIEKYKHALKWVDEPKKKYKSIKVIGRIPEGTIFIGDKNNTHYRYIFDNGEQGGVVWQAWIKEHLEALVEVSEEPKRVKKYRLIKDLPDLKAGAEFKKEGHFWTCGKMHPEMGTREWIFTEKEIKQTEWFKPVPELTDDDVELMENTLLHIRYSLGGPSAILERVRDTLKKIGYE